MKHFSIIFKPDGKKISIHAGATLLEAAGQAGIILNSVCGGKGICKKCLVKLEPDGKQVLACQYRIKSDVIVTILPGSRYFEQRILEYGIDTHLNVQPTIHEKYRDKDKIIGLAVDVGTTTVVAKLINMTNGQCLATQAALNPQSRYGDDVVSRIAYASSDAKLAELQKLIIDCINGLVVKLCKQAAVNAKHIYEMCVVGNTTMNHVFLKLPVEQLGQAPYKAFSLDAHDVPAKELNIQINPDGNVHTVENIAGFVGSDTIAVALATDIDSVEEVTLIVDIGTNGEIVLGTKDKLYAASCAAGPAFEGARITCGSRAAEGAIEAVVVDNGDIALDVIGGGEPHSICGSGLIDTVAVLLDLGVIDASGRFTKPGELSPAIADRIIEQNEQIVFYLFRAANVGERSVSERPVSERSVFLTQKDIREVQLAKAAISAGTKILQRKLGIEDNDIQHILLAGAFGNYIRPQSAMRLGLLPNVPLERIHFIGNAAGSGAQMMLLSQQCREKACELAHKIEYIEIAYEKEFTTVFADSMLF
jgi:uncharacterized 2Fe-2S/4Fe-4S cluster protein (DUF4445 family)